MEKVRAGRIGFSKLDILHRRNLELTLERFGVSNVSEEEKRTLNLAWHRLDAWPDVPTGLARLKRGHVIAPVSNGNISLMVDLARRFFRGMRFSALRLPAITSGSRASILRPRKPSISSPELA